MRLGTPASNRRSSAFAEIAAVGRSPKLESANAVVSDALSAHSYASGARISRAARTLSRQPAHRATPADAVGSIAVLKARSDLRAQRLVTARTGARAPRHPRVEPAARDTERLRKEKPPAISRCFATNPKIMSEHREVGGKFLGCRVRPSASALRGAAARSRPAPSRMDRVVLVATRIGILTHQASLKCGGLAGADLRAADHV